MVKSRAVWSGLSCGSLAGMLVHLSIVLTMYLHIDSCAAFLPALSSCIPAIVFIQSHRWKTFAVSALVSIASYITAVLFFAQLIPYGTSPGFGLGFGLIAVYTIVCCSASLAFGIAFAMGLTLSKSDR